jgi:hypothetical protein
VLKLTRSSYSWSTNSVRDHSMIWANIPCSPGFSKISRAIGNSFNTRKKREKLKFTEIYLFL